MLLCVSLVWPTKFANTLSFMQNWFNDWKFMENVRNFIFGKTGLNSLFLKIISSHTHAFCSSISMFWVVPKIFFKNCVFPQNFVSLCQFRLIQSVFRSIEIVLNCLRKPLSVSIDPICFLINRKCLWNCFKIFEKSLSVSINRNYFSINQNSWIRFLKNQIWLVQATFSKLFQNVLSLSDSARLHKEFFVVFVHSICKVFLSQGR